MSVNCKVDIFKGLDMSYSAPFNKEIVKLSVDGIPESQIFWDLKFYYPIKLV
jgi:hypothetical protein